MALTSGGGGGGAEVHDGCFWCALCASGAHKALPKLCALSPPNRILLVCIGACERVRVYGACERVCVCLLRLAIAAVGDGIPHGRGRVLACNKRHKSIDMCAKCVGPGRLGGLVVTRAKFSAYFGFART